MWDLPVGDSDEQVSNVVFEYPAFVLGNVTNSLSPGCSSCSSSQNSMENFKMLHQLELCLMLIDISSS